MWNRPRHTLRFSSFAHVLLGLIRLLVLGLGGYMKNFVFRSGLIWLCFQRFFLQ